VCLIFLKTLFGSVSLKGNGKRIEEMFSRKDRKVRKVKNVGFLVKKVSLKEKILKSAAAD